MFQSKVSGFAPLLPWNVQGQFIFRLHFSPIQSLVSVNLCGSTKQKKRVACDSLTFPIGPSSKLENGQITQTCDRVLARI